MTDLVQTTKPFSRSWVFITLNAIKFYQFLNYNILYNEIALTASFYSFIMCNFTFLFILLWLKHYDEA